MPKTAALRAAGFLLFAENLRGGTPHLAAGCLTLNPVRGIIYIIYFYSKTKETCDAIKEQAKPSFAEWGDESRWGNIFMPLDVSNFAAKEFFENFVF